MFVRIVGRSGDWGSGPVVCSYPQLDIRLNPLPLMRWSIIMRDCDCIAPLFSTLVP
jgi:hypothetical protein